MNQEVSVIVPTYNEKENIVSLITQLLDLPLKLTVVVVDDSSTDGTGMLVDELTTAHPSCVTVVHRAGKFGLGTAYITGFQQLLAMKREFIITMDADFSHPPAAIPALLAKSVQGYDLVIGSRYVPGGATVGCTVPRKALSWSANMFARAALGLQAHDTTAGFRCYRRAVLESIALDEIFSNGYAFLIEMLYKVQQRGWKVGEVPITFQNRQKGISKISRNEIYRALYTVLWLFSARITRKPL